MTITKKILYHKGALCIAALLLNIFFLSFHYNKPFFEELLLPHGEIAYNVCMHNSIKTNPERMKQVALQQRDKGALIDYADIDHSHFAYPTEYRSINDTVGYGIVLGLLWKLTGACYYWYMQIVQAILFSLGMWLFYDIAFLLFGNAHIALFCSIAQLFFFPLMYLNVQVLRDIWAYYALLLLLYGLLSYLKKGTSVYTVIMCSIFFSLFQGVRPTVFFTLATVSLAVWWWFKNERTKKVMTALGIFWITNVLLFWLPFMAYNKIAYNQYLVSPAGQDLYEGLGEFENDKGYVMDDGVFEREMKEKYGLVLGTVACDEKGKELFWQAVKEDPAFYITCLVKRLQFIFFFNPLWTSYVDDLFNSAATMKEKIRIVVTQPGSFVMKCIDYLSAKLLYVEFFLLLGWLGFFLLLLQKNYLPVVMVAAVILSSISKFPSHMEPRYLVTFYWVFSFFVGYLAWSAKEYFFKQSKS
jgi:hypothetical protein